MQNNHTRLFNEYVIIKQIGSGSFGEVYEAQNKKGDYVAVKVEDRNKAQRIYNEYKIYVDIKKSGGLRGTPKIYDYLQTQDNNIMVMQLLGPSLEDLFNDCKIFQLGTVLNLGIQCINLLEQLHSIGFIHRDIKPNNFLIGFGNDENSINGSITKVYIVDFGLSKRYINNKEHIELKNNRSLIGTARYASINMHKGLEPSRRDDLESVGYMLIYFLKGILPWQGIKKGTKNDQIKAIGDIKASTNINLLCKDIPNCFNNYIKYCRGLRFEEKPDYGYLKLLLFETAKKNNISLDLEWAN